MKKLIVFLLLFIGLGISQASADVNINNYTDTPDYYKKYSDTQHRYFKKSTENYLFYVYDETGNIITSIDTGFVKYASTTDKSLYIILANGDLLYMGILKSTNGARAIVYYNHLTDSLKVIKFGVSSNVDYDLAFGIAGNTLIYALQGSGGYSSIITGMAQIDLSVAPLGNDFNSLYTGNILHEDLLLRSSGVVYQVSNDGYAYNTDNNMLLFQCSEDFGGFCQADIFATVGDSIDSINSFNVEVGLNSQGLYSFDYNDGGFQKYNSYYGDLFDFPNMSQYVGTYIQYYNTNTNIVTGINTTEADALENILNNKYSPMLSRLENNGNTNFLYTSGDSQYLKTSTAPFDDGVIIIEEGGNGGTGTGTSVEYDEEIWNWDADGDGDVELLNGELFTGIGNMFKYFFDSLLDFFGNIKELVNKLNGIFTTEVKTFSFIPGVNAYENELTNALNGIGGEGYEETFLGKFDGFIRAFVYFFIFIIGLVVFIGLNRKKND